MSQYSEKLKHSMAAKILMPGGPSALSLSQETGISQTALSKWARFYKGKGISLMTNEARRPKDWSSKERFEAILTSQTLKGSELGVYLRKNGFTTAHLDKWKQEFIRGNEHPKIGRPPKSPTEKALMKENKALIIAGVAVVVFVLFYGLITVPQNIADKEALAEITRIEGIEEDYNACLSGAYVTYSDWWDLRCEGLYLEAGCTLPSVKYYSDIEEQYELDNTSCLNVLKARK